MSPQANSIGRAIQEMVRFFLPLCPEQSTLRELEAMAGDEQEWCHAHALFGRIRDKTLAADKAKNQRLQHQYRFEEICAKTLYNSSYAWESRSAEFMPPFDDDSSFWVIATAVQCARGLGVADPYRVARWLQPPNAS